MCEFGGCDTDDAGLVKLRISVVFIKRNDARWRRAQVLALAVQQAQRRFMDETVNNP